MDLPVQGHEEEPGVGKAEHLDQELDQWEQEDPWERGVVEGNNEVGNS